MRKLLFVCLLATLANATGAQQIDSLLARYDRKVPLEKVFVHFDNSLYTPGQMIWYKAYVTEDMLPSTLSKNLYIDWVDETGKILMRTVAPIIDAVASGNFQVPENYAGSRLQAMAYTKWMLNFDSSFLFHRELRIASKPGSKNDLSTGKAADGAALVKALPPDITLRFFPEGGDMVAGVPGYIAFKALNGSSLPVKVSGAIVDKDQKTVAQFNTEHDGMGKFLFTPLAGQTYTAQWKDPAGASRTTALPVVKTSGVVFTIPNEAVIRPYTIERSATAEERFKKLTLVGSINQQVVYKASLNLSERTKISASIPSTDFPSGVLRLTVFDNAMQPITERVVFINNEEYVLNASLRADTSGYEKRAKNVYEIELEDSIPASLSLAVTEGEGVYDSNSSIVSQLLFSSDIRGKIYEPGYYFSSPDDSVAHHLDLVMMTNGWRRFSWEDVLAQKAPQLNHAKDMGYMALAGKIDKIPERKMKKIDLVNIILQTKDSTTHYIFTPLSLDGTFREDDLILYDTTNVYYRLNQVSIPVRSTVEIGNTFLPFDPAKKNNPIPGYLPDTTGMARLRMIAAEQRRLDSLSKLTTLKEVVVRTRVRSKLEQVDDTYANGIFQGTEGSVYAFNLIDGPDVPARYNHTIGDYLRTRLPRGGRSRSTNIYNQPLPTTYFLNESIVDRDLIQDIMLEEVAYIKYYEHFVGAPGNGPALVIYTKKGKDATGRLFTDLYSTKLAGYTPVKQFYSPDHAEPQRSSLPDTRRTLYWKPDLMSGGANKKIRVSFYNNDISHSFRFTLEGMAQDGRLIHITKLFQ